MSAYYNENDPYAAQWLRNLIARGLIAHGDVDERSIESVDAAEIAGYTQCHFFAGIGGWSHALRLAGWSDDRPCWTGSCPCQPFSDAGRGAGTADPRHLWPVWSRLIGQRRPPVVFGEQVTSAIRHGWLDLVSTDLENFGYAVGAARLPAAGVGAPHLRQRLWFVADTIRSGLAMGERRPEPGYPNVPAGESGPAGGLGDTDSGRSAPGRATASPTRHRHSFESDGGSGELADSTANRRREKRPNGSRIIIGNGAQGNGTGSAGGGGDCRARPSDSFWSGADWVLCRDNKWRPIEPGLIPLATRPPARVGRLRAYGNAICAPVAQNFIEAYMSCRP